MQDLPESGEKHLTCGQIFIQNSELKVRTLKTQSREDN